MLRKAAEHSRCMTFEARAPRLRRVDAVQLHILVRPSRLEHQEDNLGPLRIMQEKINSRTQELVKMVSEDFAASSILNWRKIPDSTFHRVPYEPE